MLGLLRLAFSSSNENANQYQNGNEALKLRAALKLVSLTS
jgi:hypothetical protein